MKRPLLTLGITTVLATTGFFYLQGINPPNVGTGSERDRIPEAGTSSATARGDQTDQRRVDHIPSGSEPGFVKAREYRAWLERYKLEKRERQIEEVLGRDKKLRPMVQTLAAYPIRYEGGEAAHAWYEMSEELKSRGTETAQAIDRTLELLPAGFADERQFLIGLVTRLENVDAESKLELYGKFLERGASTSALQGDVKQFGIEGSLAILSGTELGRDTSRLPQIVRAALQNTEDPRVRPVLLGPLFRSHPKEALALAREFGLTEFSNRLRSSARAPGSE